MTRDEFDAACGQYWPELVRFAMTFVYNDHDAEDVVQGTVEELLKNEKYVEFDRDSGDATVSTWLKGCVKWHARSFLRDQINRPPRDEIAARYLCPEKPGSVKWSGSSRSSLSILDPPAENEDADVGKAPLAYVPAGVGEAIDLKGALETLEPDLRQVINLYHYEGYSEQEIANLKGWNRSKVQRMHLKAIALLKDRLQDSGAASYPTPTPGAQLPAPAQKRIFRIPKSRRPGTTINEPSAVRVTESSPISMNEQEAPLDSDEPTAA